ncbi:hypothetical protein ACIBCD_38590 [Nocardia brasiliensis]|uniref:hypothetical protein n=1 Tax=Nocardia brasiliensis TaxID=37326 RepID=UPI0037A96838
MSSGPTAGERLAGSSLGALDHHFPTRLDLIAAADDRALYDRLVPVEARLSSAIATARDAVTPAKLSAAQWNRDFTVVMDTMRGLALRLRVEPRSPSGADPWPATRTALLHLIARR